MSISDEETPKAEATMLSGTLESRNRNVETLADENRRLNAELERVSAGLRLSKASALAWQAGWACAAASLAALKQQKPVAWTLTHKLKARETTCNALLWFENPINSSWTPLYLAAGAQPVPEQCWCTTCRPITVSDMRFVVCPDCGNKRCPKAHNHANACSGSNEPGQVGSSWEHVAPAKEQP